MVIGEGLWEEGREGGREEGREKKIQGESRDIKLQFEETKFLVFFLNFQTSQCIF